MHGAVVRRGDALLEADTARFGRVKAVGAGRDPVLDKGPVYYRSLGYPDHEVAPFHCDERTHRRLNNLTKRIKRGAFGFRSFATYRTRALLYAGKPNWQLLTTITPP